MQRKIILSDFQWKKHFQIEFYPKFIEKIEDNQNKMDIFIRNVLFASQIEYSRIKRINRITLSQ